MRFLLDANLPHALRRQPFGHEVVTAGWMGWADVDDAELLSRAEASGFDALVTADRGMQYEQNLPALIRRLAIVVLIAPSNSLEALQPLVPRLLEALPAVAPGSVTRITR